MAVKTTLAIIKPESMNVKAIIDEIIIELKKEGNIDKSVLKETVSTWKEKPIMKSQVEPNFTSDAMRVLTGPTGSEKAINKWVWLDGGTRIRWALMSSNWKSKTRVKNFRSRTGAGNVVIAGRRAMQRRGIAPRPGIKAREWASTLTKQRTKPFQNSIGKAVQRGTKKLF